jgi:cytochrome P450
VLTGHTNGHWKAVRKGVANAFSMASMRSAFDVISGCCDKLQDILEVRALASGVPAGRQPAPVNVDNMLLRESMDVISVVGFERSIGALDSFDPRGDSNGITHAAAETAAGALARGDLMGSMPPEGPARDVQVLLDATKAIMERVERPHDALKVWDANVSFSSWSSFFSPFFFPLHFLVLLLPPPARSFFPSHSLSPSPNALLPPLLCQNYPPFSQNKHGHWLMAHWQSLVRDLLGHVKSVGGGRPGSFCNLLLKVRDPKTGKPLTDKQMTPEIAALFFAGIDTTGHTGTWSLYLLSQHPEVEAKIVAELDAAGLLATPSRPEPRRLEWADLNKLVYLQAFIKEVLRMYPPVGVGQVRVSHTHDLRLAAGRLVVPRGTLIWVPHHAMHNARHNWDEPDSFRPERWLETPGCEYAQRLPMPREWYSGWADETADAYFGGEKGGGAEKEERERKSEEADGGEGNKADADDAEEPTTSGSAASSSSSDRPKRYFPFAEGPRNCVGQSLAMTTLPTTLAMLLARFSFGLADSMGGAVGVAKREQYTLVTGVDGGMMMHAVPRPGVLEARAERLRSQKAEARAAAAAAEAVAAPAA